MASAPARLVGRRRELREQDGRTPRTSSAVSDQTHTNASHSASALYSFGRCAAPGRNVKEQPLAQEAVGRSLHSRLVVAGGEGLRSTGDVEPFHVGLAYASFSSQRLLGCVSSEPGNAALNWSGYLRAIKSLKNKTRNVLLNCRNARRK